MIEILEWNKLLGDEKQSALRRAPSVRSAELVRNVAAVVEAVKANGNKAVQIYSGKFDGFSGAPKPVSVAELEAAANDLSKDLRDAIKLSIRNVSAFHAAQFPKRVAIDTMAGVECALEWRPIEKVGLYVPGGLAPLFSTVVMLAVPAKLAGSARRVLCSPPDKEGKINKGILAAAYLCGVTEVFPVGGAQAIAAMAYGTETVPKVQKIFGPGNAFVTQAKIAVSQDSDGAALDMPAGPSEVMVVADDAADPAFVAADMLAQAEHGRDSQAIGVVLSRDLAQKISKEVEKQTALLSRETFVSESLKHSRLIIAESLDQALSIANQYAPEHLILQTANAASLVPQVQTAGAVFVGAFAPETAGDYASGGNHVLPTYAAARAYSGLSLQSFMRSLSVQTLSRDGLASLAPALIALAEAEGLDAHAAAVKIRKVLP
jgi:histidinol dehydrogenase